MYNTKLTRKDFSGYLVIHCGYCDAQYLTLMLQRDGYNATDSWNYDAYALRNRTGNALVILLTGYNTSHAGGMSVDDLPFSFSAYEDKARAICERGVDVSERLAALRSLLADEVVSFYENGGKDSRALLVK